MTVPSHPLNDPESGESWTDFFPGMFVRYGSGVDSRRRPWIGSHAADSTGALRVPGQHAPAVRCRLTGVSESNIFRWTIARRPQGSVRNRAEHPEPYVSGRRPVTFAHTATSDQSHSRTPFVTKTGCGNSG